MNKRKKHIYYNIDYSKTIRENLIIIAKSALPKESTISKLKGNDIIIEQQIVRSSYNSNIQRHVPTNFKIFYSNINNVMCSFTKDRMETDELNEATHLRVVCLIPYILRNSFYRGNKTFSVKIKNGKISLTALIDTYKQMQNIFIDGKIMELINEKQRKVFNDQTNIIAKDLNTTKDNLQNKYGVYTSPTGFAFTCYYLTASQLKEIIKITTKEKYDPHFLFLGGSKENPYNFKTEKEQKKLTEEIIKLEKEKYIEKGE